MKTKAITHFALPAIVIALCGFVLAGTKHKTTAKTHKPLTEDTSKKYFPITLKAFANAAILKARYDSIPWFSHVQGKTYFYVVKGEWNMYPVLQRGNEVLQNCKMGLVGPDLKEIIPVSFDLIRDIGGTFPGLIEVEKDHKRGFYNLSGKPVIPVEYDQVFPIDSNKYKAVLRKGHDLYWLKNNYTISGKTNLNITQVFGMLKISLPLTEKDAAGNIIEFNSQKESQSIYLPPSHLTDLDLLTPSMFYKKPFRKNPYPAFKQTDNLKKENITEPTNKNSNNWFKSILYSITEHFIFGRTQFYTTKKLVLVDAKRNQVYGKDIFVDYSQPSGLQLSRPYLCNEYSARAINDSLIEVKASVLTSIDLYNDDKLSAMPGYHYFALKNNKMTELQSNRIFSFTQYSKMDDRYLRGCYTYTLHTDSVNRESQQANQLSKEALLYAKNEIYASYHYKFTDKRWNDIFQENQFFKSLNPGTQSRDNVDNLLTAIDKYNIEWIDQKLKTMSRQSLTASKQPSAKTNKGL
ncbi:YARHG domain-containing protein [Mucilaginibacter sp. CAU 1740]|uniref:WG repeat-containing protein n=1 Tax=Mucilaginibacter sp. CAU 1740 TaxID=3140365 RepID=UPI00325B73B1